MMFDTKAERANDHTRGMDPASFSPKWAFEHCCAGIFNSWRFIHCLLWRVIVVISQAR